MKKTMTVLLLIICTVSILLTACLLAYSSLVRKDDIVRIGDITGINTKASLRDGSNIVSGVMFIDGEGFAHGMIMPLNGQAGLNVTSIRIIDVYGSKCTIVFSCLDDPNGSLYIEEDYPLSNLRYNATKVMMADDGVKSDLHSQRFTVRGGVGRPGPVLWILDLLGVGIYIVLILRKVRSRK